MTSLAMLAIALIAAESPPDDPAVLQGLDAAGVRMLMPSRERILKADAIVDGLGLSGAERIADVGAGPGFFSLKLARRVPRGRVIATDVDGQALAVLERRAKAAGISNIEARQVGADTPGLEKGSVDVIFMCQTDHYLKDRLAYFQQLAPALTPGGRLVIANYERYRGPGEAAALAAGFTRVGDLLTTPGHFVVVFKKAGGH